MVAQGSKNRGFILFHQIKARRISKWCLGVDDDEVHAARRQPALAVPAGLAVLPDAVEPIGEIRMAEPEHEALAAAADLVVGSDRVRHESPEPVAK